MCCVLAEREVGADIQFPRAAKKERIVKRFFSPKEQEQWLACDETEGEQLFYRLWTRKEAYGKMTGEGIVEAVGLNMSDKAIYGKDNRENSCKLVWEEYRQGEGYLAICYCTPE